MKKILKLSIMGLFLFGFSLTAQAASPEMLFSDMTDGPTSGWEGSATKGAAVSVYVRNIPETRGSSYLTVGGVNLTNDTDYAEWGATTNPIVPLGMKRITFFLNSSMTTGGAYPNTTITLTTTEGTSEPIPFHTRELGTNHIYILNQQSSPGWARENLEAGDVAYLRAGTYNQEDDDTDTHGWAKEGIMDFCYGSPKNFHDGIEGKSITFAAYPGEDVFMEAIDFDLSPRSVIRVIYAEIGYWTFAKFRMNALQPIDIRDDVENPDGKLSFVRLVNMNITTPWFDNSDSANSEWGDGIDIINGNNSPNLKILGNYIHDLAVDTWGQAQVDPVDGLRSYGMYIKGYGQLENLEVAWNEIYHDWARGLQFYGHKAHDKITNLYLHDNWIHECDRQCVVLNGGDGFSDYTYVDNSYVYNNIMDHCGDSDFALQLGNTMSRGGHGGNYEVYNNVFDQNQTDHAVMALNYDFNSLIYRNNITLTQPNAHNYWEYFGYEENELQNTPTADHNLYYGAGENTMPDWETSVLGNDNPLFTQSSPVNFLDYQLQSTSPAINAGVANTYATKDFLNIDRPQGSAYDIGAFEYEDNSPITIRSDVDQSGTTDTTDAMLTLRNSLGLDMNSTNWQPSATTGDVDCNGLSNTTDAILILRYSLGLDMSSTNWCLD